MSCPLSLNRCRVGFVLGVEAEGFRRWSQNHIAQLDPVRHVWRRHQGLQIVAAHERGRAVVDLLRKHFQQPNGNIAIQET